MKKKLIAILLVVTLIVCVIPTYAFAESPTVNSFSTNSLSEEIIIYIGEIPYRVDKNVIVGYNNVVYGEEVWILQSALVAVDHQNSDVSCHPGAVDYAFGPNTYNATKAFQAYSNVLFPLDTIAVDGACGPNTWTKLAIICN